MPIQSVALVILPCSNEQREGGVLTFLLPLEKTGQYLEPMELVAIFFFFPLYYLPVGIRKCKIFYCYNDVALSRLRLVMPI